MEPPKLEETCMHFSVKLFRVVGCWPNWEQRHKKSEKLYFFYTVIVYLILFSYTLILAYGLTIHYSAWTSLEEAIEDIIVFATGFIVLLKITLYFMNLKKLQSIIDYINKDLNAREVKDEEDASVIRSCVKHERSLTKTYVSFGYCITILYTASSIIKLLKHRASGGDYYTLPLKYPFHPRYFPMYQILYLHQMIVMILNGHVGTLADTFFSCLTYYVCSHFQIIQNRIAKEGRVITRHFVEYHNEMIRLTRSLQAIFGRFLLFQLCINSLLICLGLLQITQVLHFSIVDYLRGFLGVLILSTADAAVVSLIYTPLPLMSIVILLSVLGVFHSSAYFSLENFRHYSFSFFFKTTANIKLLHYIKCLIYVAIKLSQMFLYCWYGGEIIKKSSLVAFGAYSGSWYETLDKKTSGDLRMVLLRAQKAVEIRGGTYFILSLPTLAKVMNSAYSFFTMIKSTQKKE